ncbi:MAG: metallophosphoesterase [Spirochaetaceae bacterium]|nr:MAG: metallophosphoesterase [Spirochaetaceae bacterium]
MRIAHISDFHLPTKPGQIVNGARPDANLVEAVAVLKKQAPKPDLVVLGGDLLEDGQKGNYEAIAELFKDVQVPLHTVVGNHDDIKALQKSSLIEKGKDYRGYESFDQDKHHIILLNSAGTGKSLGNIEEEQLIWLSEDLSENHGKPVLIFMHHHPIDSHIPWLDKMKLENAEAFWEIVPPYSKNILGVFFSHLHIQISTAVRGVLVASPPAICCQYSGNNDASKAELSAEQPGFNLIDMKDWNVRVRTVRFVPPNTETGSSHAAASGKKESSRASSQDEESANTS